MLIKKAMKRGLFHEKPRELYQKLDRGTKKYKGLQKFREAVVIQLLEEVREKLKNR